MSEKLKIKAWTTSEWAYVDFHIVPELWNSEFVDSANKLIRESKSSFWYGFESLIDFDELDVCPPNLKDVHILIEPYCIKFKFKAIKPQRASPTPPLFVHYFDGRPYTFNPEYIQKEDL